MADLRLDLLPRIRQMALTHAGGKLPWDHMEDQELLQSAGLYGMDGFMLLVPAPQYLVTGEPNQSAIATVHIEKYD